MASSTYTYYYTAGTEAGSNWTNDANAWDETEGTYATREIAKNTAKETTKWIKGTANDAPSSGDDIFKVEVYVDAKGGSGYSSGIVMYAVPVIGGSTDGSEYSYGVLETYEETFSWDISSEKSTWSWSDIQNLDIKIYGSNGDYSNAHTLSIEQIYLKVTTAPASLSYRKGGSTTSVGLKGDWSTTLRPLGLRTEGMTVYMQAVDTNDGSASDMRVSYDNKTYALTTTCSGDCTGDFVTGLGYNANRVGGVVSNRLYVVKFTPTSTGLIRRLDMSNSNYNGDKYKCIVADSNGKLLAVTDEITVSSSNGYVIWLDHSVPVFSGETYYLGYIAMAGSTYTRVNGSTGDGGYIGNDYDNPTDFTPANLSSTSYKYNIDAYLKVPSNGDDLSEPYMLLNKTSLTPSTSEGSNPSNDTFNIENVGGGDDLVWSTEADSWMTVTSTGTATTSTASTVTVSYDVDEMDAGVHNGTITVYGEDTYNSPKTLPVTLTVSGTTPTIALSTYTLSPYTTVSGNALNGSFMIANSGWATLSYTISDNVNWLSCSPTSGSSTGDGGETYDTDTITVTYDTDELDIGTYNGTITVSDSNASNSPQTIAVSLTVASGTNGTWVSHFDNSDWQIEDTGAGGLGSWNSGNSEWDSQNLSSIYEVVELGELGTWNVDYRPSKVRITYTGGGTGLALYIDTRARLEVVIAQVGEPGVSYPYQSGAEVTLNWSENSDMEVIIIVAADGDTFSVTNIEFYE